MPVGRAIPPGRGQAEGLGLVVEVPPRAAALGAGRAGDRVHAHTRHPRQVDHHATVADGKARHAMATPADRHDQVMGPGEGDRRDDVGDAGAADNQRGAPVDHAIMNAAGAVVVGIAGTEQRAAHLGLELLQRGRRERRSPRRWSWCDVGQPSCPSLQVV